MKNAELTHIATLLEQASAPEEIFGDLAGTQVEKLAAARKIFLHIAKTVHPDANPGQEEARLAHSSFKTLSTFWEQAQEKIEDGTYGAKNLSGAFAPVTFSTAKGRYTLERLFTQGDLCNLYLGHALTSAEKKRVLLKVPLQPQDNDLGANEARVLRHLSVGKDYQEAKPFISQLLDAFSYEESTTGILRQVTILAYVEGFVSLKEVKAAYPGGIDPKDMAWIWRRVLVALAFAHANGVIHGCVLPTHILIHPEQHGVVLIDWSYAVLDPQTTHTWIKAISADYRAWYPAEVFARQVPGPGLDISMAASCMIYLLGGDPQQRTLPASVPWQIQSHLRGCTLPLPHQRPQDARALLQAFDQLLEHLWGPRRFHVFKMPRA